jgi:nucleoside-diphosphate-sugar epimerase
MADSMNHMVFLGFGFSAEALAAQLDPKAWRITGTSRSVEGAARISSLGYHGVVFDALDALPADTTHIVSSVPPSDAGDAVLEKFSGQIVGMAQQLKWVAYLSTTGVYGDHGGAWVDETTALTPNTKRGEKRVMAEAAWLELFEQHKIPVHLFRLAGIYGPGRNQLLTVMNGTAKRIIKDGQIFSRIHVADIAGVLAASLQKPNPGAAYNVADDEPCPPQEVVAYAAELMGLAVPPEIPFAEAKLSAMAASFYADSKRVSNARVKTELNYQFIYPNYRVGLLAEKQRLAITQSE